MTNSTQDFFSNLHKDLLSAAVDSNKSFGEPVSLPYPKVPVEDAEDMATSIKKAGFKRSFSWEQLVDNPRQGHYEPVGIKWVQWLVWALGFVVFKFWIGTEKLLRKFRHFEEVWGYEWEAAEYREFKQKTRWVEDDEQST